MNKRMGMIDETWQKLDKYASSAPWSMLISKSNDVVAIYEN